MIQARMVKAKPIGGSAQNAQACFSMGTSTRDCVPKMARDMRQPGFIFHLVTIFWKPLIDNRSGGSATNVQSFFTTAFRTRGYVPGTTTAITLLNLISHFATTP